ncbi:MAG: DNA repair protein RadA [Lachnospiraceae bacterium]|nr:DNA repair protein RadA [Lachnospiraceae bacterium]
MAKKTSVFFCSECGYESAKWMGQCPACRAWNSFVEEPVKKSIAAPGRAETKGLKRSAQATSLRDVTTDDHARVSSGMKEFDRVLGGGIVPGSLILIGGDPGIGKSTILLQVCKYLSEHGNRVLYISGEESLKQIRLRADRLGDFAGDVRMAAETDLSEIEALIDEEKPDTVVIDSIQTMYREDIQSAPGSVSQVRESTAVLMQIAKRDRITVFLVGHVTKEGTVAGPRVLEHMVDTVLYFEGERSLSYRILRAVKNRFGATNEVGVFEMSETGLKEVENPSEYMLEGRPVGASGSVVTSVMEGTRPMLLELQALVARTNFGLPRRTAAGMDYNRVQLLIAVMEKRASLSLGEYDVYLNVTGGMRVQEPALDLAAVVAIASAYLDIPLDEKSLAFGEIGLAGEIRGVSAAALRVRDAVKLGYEKIMLPAASARAVEEKYRKYCIPVRTVREAVDRLRG